MVDIHSHILPGWEMGGRTWKLAWRWLRLAAETGTTDIVATPTANSQFRYDRHRIQDIYAELSQAALGIVRIHLGCDFQFRSKTCRTRWTIPSATPSTITLLDGGTSRLVIVETAANVLYGSGGAGMIPVITHPERNVVLQSRLDTLREWVKDGCLVQVPGNRCWAGLVRMRASRETLLATGPGAFHRQRRARLRGSPPRLGSSASASGGALRSEAG